jgi:hypothetical protein
MKGLIKALLRPTPYRVVKAGALNRFDAIEEMLLVLRERGFRPTRVIDGGANVGEFARKAKTACPGAKIEMIEPQPDCREALSRMAAQRGYAFHPVALVGPSHTNSSIAMNLHRVKSLPERSQHAVERK